MSRLITALLHREIDQKSQSGVDPARGLMNNLNWDDDSALLSVLTPLEIYTVKIQYSVFCLGGEGREG